MPDKKNNSNIDLSNIWLPYSQMKTALLPKEVIGTLGTRIKLSDGSELIDGIASWWTACHGYNHPYILAAIETQLKLFPHVMFGGLVHEPALKLANMLVEIAPQGLAKVFFSDSGSTAVEVAMKMAVQYWLNQGDKKKNRFVCFHHAYHGDTMGAMSVSDPDKSMHKLFSTYMPMQYVVDIPLDEFSFSEFKELIGGIKKTVAGIIIEPLVQAAGGMKFHSADILAEIKKIATNNDILFIADEVATGFGRTGNMFACNEAGITPDIMCLGKALTGGTIGMAATLATDKVFEKFYDDSDEHALMHGPTYMANPMAAAAAIASLELFTKEIDLRKIEKIELQLDRELGVLRGIAGIKDVRVKGAIGVVQLSEMSGKRIKELRQKFIELGCWIRPIEDVVYLMPAFTITEADLSKLTSAVVRVLNA